MTKKVIDMNPEEGWSFSSCIEAGDFIFTAHHGGVRGDEGGLLTSIAII